MRGFQGGGGSVDENRRWESVGGGSDIDEDGVALS